MEPRAPVLLLVLVETAQLRWFVASISLDGRVTPLLCSEVGDLDKYRGLDFDEQVAFLRHRFCGVLQRGADRLWGREQKACQFVFVFDEPLPEPTGELTLRISEHLAMWLMNPPAAFFCITGEPDGLAPLAGSLSPALAELLIDHLPEVLTAREDPTAWELSRKKV